MIVVCALAYKLIVILLIGEICISLGKKFEIYLLGKTSVLEGLHKTIHVFPTFVMSKLKKLQYKPHCVQSADQNYGYSIQTTLLRQFSGPHIFTTPMQ